jgi:hypothetical protein
VSEDKEKPDTLAALIEALASAPVRFWTCPIREHSERKTVTVEWKKNVAYCTEPSCFLNSENVRAALCDNYREDVDRECRGFLRFKPGDVQAQCPECGGWTGYLVAHYIERKA